MVIKTLKITDVLLNVWLSSTAQFVRNMIKFFTKKFRLMFVYFDCLYNLKEKIFLNVKKSEKDVPTFLQHILFYGEATFYVSFYVERLIDIIVEYGTSKIIMK